MTTLIYPTDQASDSMQITIHEYQSRPERGGVRENVDAQGPPQATIMLPIPELPNLVSQQKYGQISGAWQNVLAGGLGEGYNAIANGGEFNQDTISGIAGRLRDEFNDAGGPVLREIAAGIAGSIVGITGPMFQTLASGEITNPQIELLYNGPGLRSYSFNWTFAPKNSVEARTVFEIVRTLKKYHLPEKDGGMLKVPSVFKISLNVKGSAGEFYQKYFTSVLEAISYKQDSGGSHITLPNGEPVISSLSCVFKEIFINTRDDFENNI